METGNQASRDAYYDLIRGIAVLVILQAHAREIYPFQSDFIQTISLFGRFGVQLFYFVSALTMCLIWNKRSDENRKVEKFYIRRFFRIAPLFWLVIPLMPLYLYFTHQPYMWAPEGIHTVHIVLTALFLHGFWPDTINSVVPGGWSIAVEMTFYFLFPLVFVKIRRRDFYLWFAMIIFFFNVLFFQPWARQFFHEHAPQFDLPLINEFLYCNFLNQCPVFLLGCYLFYSDRKETLFNSRTILLPFLLWIGGAVLCWYIWDCDWRNVEFLTVFLCLYLFVDNLRKTGLAESSIISNIGEYTYVIYLANLFVIRAVGLFLARVLALQSGVLGFFVTLLISVPICYLIALIARAVIERPIQNRVNSLIRRLA